MDEEDIAEVVALVQQQAVRDLLAERMGREAAAALAAKLATGTWTHDYGISAEEAKGARAARPSGTGLLGGLTERGARAGRARGA